MVAGPAQIGVFWAGVAALADGSDAEGVNEEPQTTISAAKNVTARNCIAMGFRLEIPDVFWLN